MFLVVHEYGWLFTVAWVLFHVQKSKALSRDMSGDYEPERFFLRTTLGQAGYLRVVGSEAEVFPLCIQIRVPIELALEMKRVSVISQWEAGLAFQFLYLLDVPIGMECHSENPSISIPIGSGVQRIGYNAAPKIRTFLKKLL